MGILAFWISWPALWIYLRRGERTRLLLVCNGEFLVLKSWLRAGRRWNLPGGGLHDGEQPDAGLMREVREETGITLSKQQITPCLATNLWLFGRHWTEVELQHLLAARRSR